MYDWPTGRLGDTNSAVAAGTCGFVIPTCGCAQSTALGVVRAAPRIIQSEDEDSVEYRWNPFVWFVSFTWSQYPPSLGPEPKPRVSYIIQWCSCKRFRRHEARVFGVSIGKKLHFCGPIKIWHLICSFPNVNSVGVHLLTLAWECSIEEFLFLGMYHADFRGHSCSTPTLRWIEGWLRWLI